MQNPNPTDHFRPATQPTKVASNGFQSASFLLLLEVQQFQFPYKGMLSVVRVVTGTPARISSSFIDPAISDTRSFICHQEGCVLIKQPGAYTDTHKHAFSNLTGHTPLKINTNLILIFRMPTNGCSGRTQTKDGRLLLQ